MSTICVVHLVRKANGPRPVAEFIRSYLENAAGVSHDLLFIFKGFRVEDNPEEYLAATDFPFRSHRVLDFGYDIRAYLKAAGKFDYDYYVFLNSFSVILDRDWLRRMRDAISGRGVGVVGATGSWMSHYSHVAENPKIGGTVEVGSFHVPLPGLAAPALRRVVIASHRKQFDPFPNPHIRTNAFMISRDHLRSVPRSCILRKKHAHRFESGKAGLTKQLLRRNLKALVVGRDGNVYAPDEWPASNTFWQGDQGNLLVADNMTRRYSEADAGTRAVLSRWAWGKSARPGGNEKTETAARTDRP